MILIFGGTGTLGQAIARTVKLSWYENIRIFARSEYEEWDMRQRFPKFDYVIGDIRDLEAVQKSICGVTHIINCAAMKHVPICNENPEEAVKTNIFGAMNIIKAVRHGIKVVHVSTDKAVNPSNIYGATKCVAEHLFLLHKHVVVRLPNIYGSSGSVIELWERQHKEGKPLTVTDKECARFFISPEKAAQFVWEALQKERGLYIPEFEECNIYELAKELYPNDEIVITGLRDGEKIKEEI